MLRFCVGIVVKKEPEADWLRDVVLGSLDDESETPDLARRTYHSRTQFHRLFRALLVKTPAAMRRRLLLERSAWQLGRTAATVTDIALEAQYGSLEAFTRAFRKVFGVSPSIYRRMGAQHFRLAGGSGVRFRGMLAHVITYNSYRRLTAAAALRDLGVDDAGFGDSIEYEREAAEQ